MGGKSTTVVQPQLSPEDTELKQLQLTFLKRQLAELEKPPTPEQQEVERLGQQRLLSVLRGEAPTLSPEQEANLQTIFGAQQRRGEEDIRRFGVELAGARGLNLSDTPIGGELLRQQARLGEGLRVAEAGARLDIPRAQQLFAEETRRFQEQLARQAEANRFALFRPQLGPAGQTVTSRQGIGLSEIGSLAGGVGGLSLGLAAFSSREFKKDITPLFPKDEAKATEAIRETPIYTWRYKGGLGLGDDTHIGPVTEEAPPAIVTDDGKKLDVISTIGLGLAAIKDVDARVRALEEKQ